MIDFQFMTSNSKSPKFFLSEASRHGGSLQRAVAALNSQHPQEAEKIANDVLKANPRHIRALHILGAALVMQGRANDAIAALEPAARTRRDPSIDTQLAIALRQTGRYDDALSRLRLALKRKPPYVAAFNELGGLLYHMRRFDEVISVLSQGLAIAPFMLELPILLGHAFLAVRNSAGAKAAFTKALAIAPDAPGALWGMGKAHQLIGENRSAVDYFRRCLMFTPADAGTWLNLGHSLLEIGEVDAGYQCFRTAAQGNQRHCYAALTTLVKAGRGRFWLRPSQAMRFFRDENKF